MLVDFQLYLIAPSIHGECIVFVKLSKFEIAVEMFILMFPELKLSLLKLYWAVCLYEDVYA